MILFPSWKHFLASRPSNDAGNANPNAYLSAWSGDTSSEAKLNLLTNDPSTAILAGDNSNNIMILHGFKNLGGSILSPADKFVCLLGTNRLAPIIAVNEVVVSENSDIVTPTADAIIACNDMEELLNLNAPLAENDPETTYSGGNTFLPPPWLLNAVIGANSDDPFKLILAANTGATQFNDEQLAKDQNYVPNTTNTLNKFVMWAWGIKRNLFPPVTFFIDPHDTEAENYHIQRHQTFIQPLPSNPPPGAPPVFNAPPPATTTGAATMGTDEILHQLTVSITRQSEQADIHNELFARQLEHSLEKEDKKKDRLKKFHASIKQLILFASASDAEMLPDDIIDSCKRVFNAETLVNAEQELTLQFTNLNMQDASFAPGFVAALYAGKFLWSKNFTPSNFSPFMICEAEPLLTAENQQRHLILHLEDTNGKTSEDMTTGGKNSVKAPTTYHAMFQQLKFFRGACEIFFGKSSIAYTSLSALIQIVDRSKHIFKSHEVDTHFMTKFLLAIDKRFQLWLDACMTVPTRTDVDDSTLNFLPLVESVRFGTFDLRLPLTFKEPKTEPVTKHNKRTGNGGGGGGDDDQATTGNSQKKKRKSDNERIVNENQPEQFKMKQGETWATHFANKNVQSRVPWGDSESSNVKMCPRWFIAGHCFKNCYHKTSHVKADEVPTDKSTAFKTFLDNIRNGGNN